MIIKRFADGKLLVVITDGKKFGNVVTVQCQKLTQQEGDEGDEELSRMMMLEAQMMRGGEDADGFDELDGEDKKKIKKGEDEEEQD